MNDSTLTVFTAPDHEPAPEVAKLAEAMRSTAARHDLNAPEAMRDWFERVYWATDENLDREGIVRSFVMGRTEVNFPYRTTAEAYRMVESNMVPVIIPTPENAQDIDRLEVEQVPSGALARALQPYTVQIPARARDQLRAHGRGEFRAQSVRADQFFVLTDSTLYRKESGLWWESADILGDAQW